MKRTVIILSLIFALAIALSVSIPTLAATSGNTAVKGTLTAKIEVVAPSGLATLTLDPGASPVDGIATAGSVKCNNVLWTVTATATGTGQMASNESSTDKLAVLKVDIGAGFVDITTSPTITGTARTAGTAIPLTVRQAVAWTDVPHTDYYLLLTFAGTMP